MRISDWSSDVCSSDLLIAIAGEFVSDADPEDAPSLVERDDGSLLVSGNMAADTLADRIDITLPEDRDYATVAGFALAVFRHLPVEGESRSEEHTSELQSLMRTSYAVFSLTKKKT